MYNNTRNLSTPLIPKKGKKVASSRRGRKEAPHQPTSCSNRKVLSGGDGSFFQTPWQFLEEPSPHIARSLLLRTA